MSKSWLLVLVCVLPGCSVLSTDCAHERAELRKTESAIAHAARHRTKGFTAQLASRGHAAYDCVPGPSGQVHCTKRSAKPARNTDLPDLYRKHDAVSARIGDYCS